MSGLRRLKREVARTRMKWSGVRRVNKVMSYYHKGSKVWTQYL